MIEAVAYVTRLLFADNRDAATAMSKSCGGGAHLLNLAVTRRMMKMAGRLHTAASR